MKDKTIRERLQIMISRVRFGAVFFALVWVGFVLLYVFTGQGILKTENTILANEKVERTFLTLQKPLIVYLETHSPSQKVRFDKILQEMLSKIPEYAGNDTEIAAPVFQQRVKGIIFQIRALGNTLFLPDIGAKQQEQLTLSLTNLIFESVHQEIHPLLIELRSQERSSIHQMFLIILFNSLFLVFELALLLWIGRPLKNYVEESLLTPLENLAVWARGVAKGEHMKSGYIESFPKDAEIRDLVESIRLMKESLFQALGQTERKLQHNELLSMIIQASGFMSREEDILDVSRQALMVVFSEKPIEIHFHLGAAVEINECWALRKGGLISDQDWNGLVRCHQCEHPLMEKTYLCAPIQSSEDTIGTITLRAREKVDWTEEDRSFLRDVAEHVGMSISKLRLMHRHRNEAILDPLTGLYNRRYLEDFFQRVVALMRRHGKPYTFIMLDVDHFKEINDTHGHETGDLVLREFAEIIQGSMRQGEDMSARIGGEEFAVIVFGDKSQAFIVAEKIRKKVEFRWSGSKELNMTISAGLSEFSSESPLSEVMKEADRALYRAKREGRNRTVMAGEREKLV
ncbi:MAG: GGDEF domain-containing protein [Leptospirillum sp.]